MGNWSKSLRRRLYAEQLCMTTGTSTDLSMNCTPQAPVVAQPGLENNLVHALEHLWAPVTVDTERGTLAAEPPLSRDQERHLKNLHGLLHVARPAPPIKKFRSQPPPPPPPPVVTASTLRYRPSEDSPLPRQPAAAAWPRGIARRIVRLRSASSKKTNLVIRPLRRG